MTSICRFVYLEISASSMKFMIISMFQSIESLILSMHRCLFFCVCWFRRVMFFSFEFFRFLVVVYFSIDWIFLFLSSILSCYRTCSLISLSFCWRRCIVVFASKISSTWSRIDIWYVQFFFVSFCISFFMNCVLFRTHNIWFCNFVHIFFFVTCVFAQ